ncbi:hypothetical protein BJY24_007173 [Nocardia transvalensis]|uniref:Mammalian cell entry protein n=1 Tax=Nocardia transvalensis TaxID=37333 RepID=A0A7W9PLG4_9NOCA|nr:hypothetical protein [Nocardia transvalensis]MBB5918261.1 hypothetical protein [Nocardia transvalensis]
MPVYILPGTEVGPRRARILGFGALVLAVLVVVGWRVMPDNPPADQIHVALLTGHVGEGIASGTDVRLDGVRVGSVGAIATEGPGRQRVELTLAGSQLFGLTNALSIDYVPGNLFGISALQLHSRPGGTALGNGATVDLTGDADRVQDATLSALLDATGKLTAGVLTPKLSELLAQVSRDVSAFTPLLQAIGATARAFAETQQLPPSVLFDRYGSALQGVPPLIDGGLTVLRAAYTNEYLKSPEHIARYRQMFSELQYNLLPAVMAASGVGQQYFGDFIPIATTVLDRLSSSVGDPERSGQQLSELLDRLGGAFHDTPDGPVLNARIDLVPGVAGPLAAQLGPQALTGGH